MILRSFKVDFNVPGRASEFVDRRKLWDNHWLTRFFNWRRPTLMRLHRMWVVAKPDAALQIADPEKLIVIEAQHTLPEPAAEYRDFLIDSNVFPYDLRIHLDKILDFTDPHRTWVEFDVHLGLLRKKKGKDEGESYRVRLELTPAQPAPVHWVELNDDFVAGYEHHPDPAVPLGSLYIANATAVQYAQPLDCRAYIHNDRPHEPNPVSFGPVSPEDREGAETEIDAEGRLTVRKLAPRARVKIPLFVNLTLIPHPDEPTTRALRITLDGKAGLPPPFETQYRLVRNSQGTALTTAIAESGAFRSLEAPSLMRLQEKTPWDPASSGSMDCFTVRIGNAAHGGAGRVVVRNLAFSFKNDGKIRWKPGAGFRVNGRPFEKIDPGYDLPSQPGSHRDFVVSFLQHEITGLDLDVVPVRCQVRFDFSETASSQIGEGRGKFEAEIEFKVERDLGTEWLAIDFGTSAIVVSDGTPGMGEVKLVNLQESLKKFLPESEFTNQQVPEFGTPFLSSAIRLKATQALEATDPKESLVELAPLFSDLSSADHPIPYVKALIGTDQLPDITGHKLGSLEYRPTPGDPLRTFAEQPIETKALVREVYTRLLADFVGPALRGTHPRKLVLSVPNSFTPRDIDQLRTLITDKFPQYSKEYLTFVSESDAVACFYIANWGEINRRRPGGEPDRPAEHEYVMIYDMGAGTLDLTYLHIHTAEDGHRSVTIIGRMGRSTAGNYLDYVLAHEIYRQHRMHFRFPMFGPIVDADRIVARHQFKKMVQNEIKPALDRQDVFPLGPDHGLLKDGSAGIEVSLADLRRSGPVEEFIDESTRGVLRNFFALFPSYGGPPHQERAVPLDTVVLSGRSMQLRRLRDAVERELKTWSRSGDELFVVDHLDPQTLKSAVVQGAAHYAGLYRRPESLVSISSRNIQARYGLLYKDPLTNRIVFKELLNPSTKPVPTQPAHDGATVVYSYDTQHGGNGDGVVDLRNTSVAMFVQSFAEDTAADANAGRWEYITIMDEFRVDAVAGSQLSAVAASVTVDSENRMQVKLGRKEPGSMPTLRMNLFDSKTFKAGMWPFLPGDEDDR